METKYGRLRASSRGADADAAMRLRFLRNPGLPQVLSQVEEKVNKQQYLGSMLRITVTKKQR